MKLKFLGAAQTVTGSCHYVETEYAKFVVDCGLFQGSKATKEYNYIDFKIDPSSLNFMILTHAHIDHSGLIPKLVKHGFKGPIYCTAATAELARILLLDSAHIQESEIERKNRKNLRAGIPLLEPIYSTADAAESLQYLTPVPMQEIQQPALGLEFCLQDAGHILGSTIVEIWAEEKEARTKIVFSGDLGQNSQPIINDPTVIKEADYVVIESTYGDRIHRKGLNRRTQLKAIIEETMKKGGNLIIPAFAVERTQDLLYDLSDLYYAGELDPKINIVIDSPLAVAATEIFQKNIQYYDEVAQKRVDRGEHPLELPNLRFSKTQQESMELNQVQGRHIIISASGMCDAGRIKHHLKHNLWRRESTILFVGYQAEGSLGRRILEGNKIVRIHGEEVNVLADIRTIEAFSAHADQRGLLEWLAAFESKPKQVIIVHGEFAAQKALGELIQNKLQLKTLIPEWLDEFNILPGLEEKIQPVKTAIPDSLFEQELVLEAMYLKVRQALHELISEPKNQEHLAATLETLQQVEAILKRDNLN